MLEEENLNENLVVNTMIRSTVIIDREMEHFKAEHEGDIILNDIMLLEEMGYEKKMINKVYILLKPENMERALDYMTEIDGIYQHDFFESNNKSKDVGLCFICKKPKRFHINYDPNLLEDDIKENNLKEENELLIDDKNEKISITDKDEIEINNICNVCYDDIERENIKFNLLPCGHICCTECWSNYLKTLISEAKVERVKCVEHSCNAEIPEEFILKHINNEEKLIEKYNRFKIRASIFKDPNKKQCPEPDCESYLEKGNKKYVKCKIGHEYCFECLRKPHGNSTCEEFMEKEFNIWKVGKRVKKCPRCKIYTEKNEGCNHMTCTSCKYQWCWLCEEQYSYGHYDRGKCKGYQFTVADNLKEANLIQPQIGINNDIAPINRNNINNNRRNRNNRNREETNCFCLHSIFPKIFKMPLRRKINSCSTKYLYIFLMWSTGFFYFFLNSLFLCPALDSTHIDNCCSIFICVFMGIPLSICYHILFTGLITPFLLISFFYPNFINYITKFLCIRPLCY